MIKYVYQMKDALEVYVMLYAIATQNAVLGKSVKIVFVKLVVEVIFLVHLMKLV